MTLRVALMKANPLEWDTFVRAQADWTAFHLAAWKPLIERVFGHECLYLEARDEAGALHGVLPLVRVQSLLFGHYLVSMPFVNYGGPLGSAPAVRALVDHAVALAADSGVRLLELRSRTALPVDLPVSHRKITVVLDLPADVEGLRKALGAKLRSQIKRPEKEGVTVRFGPDQVDPFFEVFSRHMRDLGTPTQPRRLFQEIAAGFGDDAWFGCAWLGSQPVACGAGFRWGSEFEITWASSLREYNRVAPNMLLYWAFLERAVQQRLTLFNFGRCTPGEGTHHFKKQWGSRDEQLWWYQSAREAGTGTPSPDDSAYSWGPRLWKRLPLPVATALGPRLVRGIP
jgi:FemAB-related protein (PEP-CTERM system-associated)